MILLVDLPPPVHGMSTINKKFIDFVSSCGIEYKFVDTAGFIKSKNSGRLVTIVSKLLGFFCNLARIVSVANHPHKLVYRSINGGLGQLYDCFYMMLFRLFGFEIIIHHHSFAYLTKKSLLFKVLLRITGSNAKHIALGVTMKTLLSEKYDIDENSIIVLSNACFFSDSNLNSSEQSKVGSFNHSKNVIVSYLSNLTLDKGIDVFISLSKYCSERSDKYSFRVGGPIVDPRVTDIIKPYIDEGLIEYLGPVYAKEKETFIQETDVFIFPSRYINEAEPLVVFEFASAGALLITSQRGELKNIVPELGGCAIHEPNVIDLYDKLDSFSSAKMFTGEEKKKRTDIYNQFCAQRRLGLDEIKAFLRSGL